MSSSGPTYPAYDNSPHAATFFGRRSVRDTWIALVAKQTFGAVRFAQTNPSTGRVATGPPVTTGLDRGPYVEGVAPIQGDEQGPTNVAGTSAPVHDPGTARTAPAGFFSRAVDNMLAVVFLWAILMLFVESRIIDMVLGTFQMLLLLAMLIAAYSVG
ncbi:hypothetical protein BGZ70_008496, partial [Mortierella alpina]